jgi:hypothetical protein
LVAQRVEEFLTVAQSLQELLVTLENYDGNHASFFFMIAQGLQECLAAIEENFASYQVSRDEQDDDDSGLDDQEPVFAEFESYVELHDEDFQVLSSMPTGSVFDHS